MNPQSIKLRIVNKLGLHARASACFVKEAVKYESEIFVSKGDNKVNGKSIMGLLTLAASFGEEITLEIDGPDAKAALMDLKELINSGFHEE